MDFLHRLEEVFMAKIYLQPGTSDNAENGRTKETVRWGRRSGDDGQTCRKKSGRGSLRVYYLHRDRRWNREGVQDTCHADLKDVAATLRGRKETPLQRNREGETNIPITVP